MLYSISENNLHIINSFDYRKKEMQKVLSDLRNLHPRSMVWWRDMQSLIDEWCVHNALYRLHIMRSHTADVDLNNPCRAEWLYILFAPFARLIIK